MSTGRHFVAILCGRVIGRVEGDIHEQGVIPAAYGGQVGLAAARRLHTGHDGRPGKQATILTAGAGPKRFAEDVDEGDLLVVDAQAGQLDTVGGEPAPPYVGRAEGRQLCVVHIEVQPPGRQVQVDADILPVGQGDCQPEAFHNELVICRKIH